MQKIRIWAAIGIVSTIALGAAIAWAADGAGNTYGAVAVATASATAIPGAANRRSVSIQNLGPNDEFCGFDSSVTTATGTKVPASGGSVSMNVNNNVAVFCIAATALQVSPNDTRYANITQQAK